MGVNQILLQEIGAVLHANVHNRLTPELINGLVYAIKQRIEKNLMEVALTNMDTEGTDDGA